jgi:hypothetical protein
LIFFGKKHCQASVLETLKLFALLDPSMVLAQVAKSAGQWGASKLQDNTQIENTREDRARSGSMAGDEMDRQTQVVAVKGQRSTALTGDMSSSSTSVLDPLLLDLGVRRGKGMRISMWEGSRLMR